MCLSLKVTVPDTSADMSVEAIPLASEPTIVTGWTTILPADASTVYIMHKDGDPPTAQEVVDNGMPCAQSISPLWLQDPGGNPLPSLSEYYAAKSDPGTADLRVIC